MDRARRHFVDVQNVEHQNLKFRIANIKKQAPLINLFQPNLTLAISQYYASVVKGYSVFHGRRKYISF
jgi:hypothetical protein